MKMKVLFNACRLPLPEMSPVIFVLGNMQVWEQGLVAKAFSRLLSPPPIEHVELQAAGLCMWVQSKLPSPPDNSRRMRSNLAPTRSTSKSSASPLTPHFREMCEANPKL